jgi:histone-lysine N-methyltransferase SETMAR
VREFLMKHSPYSPDLAPSDFILFLKMKKILKGRHFYDIDDTSSNMTAALKAIPQNQFQNCFEGWTRRWHQCIASQGQYSEGD